MKTLIIDDEGLARARVRRLLEDHWPEIELAGQCGNGTEAIAAIGEHEPDFIFLDIQMKDMTGFEVLEAIEPADRPLVIFVTAYDEYAIRAFDYLAFDYLLKPFQDDRFNESVRRICDRLRGGRAEEDSRSELDTLLQMMRSQNQRELFPLREGTRISFVAPREIRYVVASGYYIEVHTTEKRHLIRCTLGQMEEELEPYGFVRIHRSTIINPDYLSEIHHVPSGDLEVRLRDGQLFRVSKSYREGLMTHLKLG